MRGVFVGVALGALGALALYERARRERIDDRLAEYSSRLEWIANHIESVFPGLADRITALEGSGGSPARVDAIASEVEDLKSRLNGLGAPAVRRVHR